MRDQRKTDADQLKLLYTFHFIIAGLAIVGVGFLFLHYALMHTLLANVPIGKNQNVGNLPPQEFFGIFKWFYLFFGGLLLLGGAGNLISGMFMRNQKNRTFSLIIAGINCLQFPLGTALGVFTFIVLLRDSVREIYDA